MTDFGRPKAPVKTRGQRFLPEKAEEERLAEAEVMDASAYLLRALGTPDPEQKKYFSQKGLSLWHEDDELKALLLRQLYLAELEQGHDAEALRIATAMVELGTLGDLARQDAARAALAIGDSQIAIGHLRIAARVCPPERQAFHYGHLGALLRFSGQPEQAVEAFARASRCASEDRTLYLAAQALAEAHAGRSDADFETLRDKLESERLKGYALWVLGELCLLTGDQESGIEYLERFISRQNDVPRAQSLSLQGEIAHAKALLHKISA